MRDSLFIAIFLVVGLSLISGCGPSANPVYQNESQESYTIRHERISSNLYRWVDRDMGVVCYRSTGSANLSCVKLDTPPTQRN